MANKIGHLIEKDLDIIKKEVEKEFKLSLRKIIRRQRREYVDARRVFIALVLFVYNDMQEKIGLVPVTLTFLSDYLGYKSHSSICLHLINSHKGGIGLEEYVMINKKLREPYLKLKSVMERETNSPTFVKFLKFKKKELEKELKIINTCLKKHCEDEEKREAVKSSS